MGAGWAGCAGWARGRRIAVRPEADQDGGQLHGRERGLGGDVWVGGRHIYRAAA